LYLNGDTYLGSDDNGLENSNYYGRVVVINSEKEIKK